MTAQTPNQTPNQVPNQVPKPGPGFDEILAFHGVELDGGDIPSLQGFLEYLYAVNESMNLTRIAPEDAWSRHIADSLSLLPAIASEDAKTVIDVGSGGGLPAIPLAICLPGVHFHLIESTAKKAAFLEAVAVHTGLANVTVHAERAEKLGEKPKGLLRGCGDVVTSRAVGRLKALAGWCMPLLKPGGLMLSIKGEQAQAEVDEADGTLRRIRLDVVDVRRGPTGTVVAIRKRG